MATMKKIFLILSLLISLTWKSNGQSAVVLTSLSSMAIDDPATAETNLLIITLHVSDPAQVDHLQVFLHDRQEPGLYDQTIVPLAFAEGKYAVVIGEYSYPLQEDKITFALKVRDQQRQPYDMIRIVAIDKAGNTSNELHLKR